VFAKTALLFALPLALAENNLSDGDVAVEVAQITPKAGPALRCAVQGRGRLSQARQAERGPKSCTRTRPWLRSCFTMFEPGTYAVAMFQDLNKNGILDTGLFGKPRSRWLQSGGAPGHVRPTELLTTRPSPTARKRRSCTLTCSRLER